MARLHLADILLTGHTPAALGGLVTRLDLFTAAGDFPLDLDQILSRAAQLARKTCFLGHLRGKRCRNWRRINA